MYPYLFPYFRLLLLKQILQFDVLFLYITVLDELQSDKFKRLQRILQMNLTDLPLRYFQSGAYFAFSDYRSYFRYNSRDRYLGH